MWVWVIWTNDGVDDTAHARSMALKSHNVWLAQIQEQNETIMALMEERSPNDVPEGDSGPQTMRSRTLTLRAKCPLSRRLVIGYSKN